MNLNYPVHFGGHYRTSGSASEREEICALTLKAFGHRIMFVPNPLSSMPVTYRIEGRGREDKKKERLSYLKTS